MAVLSVLKTLNRFNLVSRFGKNVGQSVRGSHEGEFPMRPGVWQWNRFKDQLHFYILIGVIPLTIITTYVNIVVGPAELAEIPEGYEPKHWEYYRSPVSRFLARYFIRDKRIDYEGMISFMNEESERVILKKMEQMVKNFMKNRSDYQSWYYRPIDAYGFRFDREEWKYTRDYVTGEKDYVADENMFSDGGNPTQLK